MLVFYAYTIYRQINGGTHDRNIAPRCSAPPFKKVYKNETKLVIYSNVIVFTNSGITSLIRFLSASNSATNASEYFSISRVTLGNDS